MMLKRLPLILFCLGTSISLVHSAPISETTHSFHKRGNVAPHILRRGMPKFIQIWDLWVNWEKAIKENPVPKITISSDTPTGTHNSQIGLDGVKQEYWTFQYEYDCNWITQYVQLSKELGSGAFGQVYSGVLSEFNETTQDWHQDWNIAIKKAKKGLGEMIAGAKLRQSVVSEYLAPVLDFFYVEEPRAAFLIMPKASTTIDAKVSPESVSRATIDNLFYDILLGVQKLHTPTDNHPHGIMHRDLKPSNILMFNGAAKISDFDSMTADSTSNRWHVGTPGYVAPEVVRAQSPYNKAIDIFALGMTYLDIAMHGIKDDDFYKIWKALVGPSEGETFGLSPDDVEKVLIKNFGKKTFDENERAVLSYVLCEHNERFDIETYVSLFESLMRKDKRAVAHREW